MTNTKLRLLVALGICLGASSAAALQTVSPPVTASRSLPVAGSQQNLVIPVDPPTVVLINALPYMINSQGYYKLATSLSGTAGQNGITVNASDVYIDLNGKRLNGSTGSLIGIKGDFRTVVFNGTIEGWGEEGVTGVDGCALLDVRVNGCGKSGVALGNAGLVQRCKITSNRQSGVVGKNLTVLDCTIESNDENGILGMAPGMLVKGCRITANILCGITALDPVFGSGDHGNDAVVEDCHVFKNGLHGICLSAAARISNCTVRAHISSGILVGSKSRIDRCVVTDCLVGITTGPGSSVRDCTVADCASGIFANSHSSVVACEVTDSTTIGIVVRDSGSARDCTVVEGSVGILLDGLNARAERCTVSDQDTIGIQTSTDSLVTGCSVFRNATCGIFTPGTGCKLDGNMVGQNGVGIDVPGTRNLIVRNTLDSNTVQKTVGADNVEGPYVKTKGFLENVSPWANFDLSFPTTFP